MRDNGALYIDKKAVRGWGEVTAGYEWFIKNGVNGIVKLVEAEGGPGRDAARRLRKEAYLDSLLVVAEGC